MKVVKKTILFLTALLILFLSNCQPFSKEKTPYVLILSMDAFRWDYPDMYNTPNLDSIAKVGVKAKSLKSSFPTKTFPNHYTIATGLYPDNHGIVQNSFYDAGLNKYYSIGNREAVTNPAFYGGEPIWVTAEKQGITTASYFWVGSETKIKNIQPTIWKKYDHNFPFEQRIDSVIAWLQLPEEKRPRLIMWYMNEPDDVGHNSGPYATETANKISYLDSLVGVFVKKINQLPNASQINLIFTADHGMGPISDERSVQLKDYIKENWVEMVQGGNPVYLIDAKEEKTDSVFLALKQIEHIQAWKSSQVPERLHYGKNPRTMDFVVAADSLWSIYWGEKRYSSKGTHGYDNNNTDMHAIFYAVGPDFKQNYLHPTFNNVDIYDLIAHILNIEPVKTDGDFNNVKGLLKNEK